MLIFGLHNLLYLYQQPEMKYVRLSERKYYKHKNKKSKRFVKDMSLALEFFLGIAGPLELLTQ